MILLDGANIQQKTSVIVRRILSWRFDFLIAWKKEVQGFSQTIFLDMQFNLGPEFALISSSKAILIIVICWYSKQESLD
jgi:hypothetical protein